MGGELPSAIRAGGAKARGHLLGNRRSRGEQVDVRADREERAVDLVGDAGGELAERGEPLRWARRRSLSASCSPSQARMRTADIVATTPIQPPGASAVTTGAYPAAGGMTSIWTSEVVISLWIGQAAIARWIWARCSSVSGPNSSTRTRMR